MYNPVTDQQMVRYRHSFLCADPVEMENEGEKRWRKSGQSIDEWENQRN